MKNKKIFITTFLISSLLHLAALIMLSKSSEWTPSVTISSSALNINVQSRTTVANSNKPAAKKAQAIGQRGQKGISESALPSVIGSLAPEYPWRSRMNEEQGEVVASVRINDAGKAFAIKVIKSSGFNRLDESAINAIKLATFSKGSGTQKIELTLNFELRDKK